MRQSWDEYFLSIAEHASTRATCDRLRVGCVLVRGRDLISTGYNGSLSGTPHCDEVGHDMDEGHCVRTIHAEMNALCMAARNGHITQGSTAYTTHFPCWLCFKLLVQAGVTRIVYRHIYRMNERVSNFSKEKNIELLQIKGSTFEEEG